MALINKSIPSLFNGVSQQPATLRHDTQAEVCENAYPTIATGLRKRPPLTYLAKFTSSVITNAGVHIINRDTTERYAVFATNGNLQIYSLVDGLPRGVSFPNGVGYLASSSPSTDFEMVTVADYTFVLNKSISVTPGGPSALNPSYLAYFAIVLAEPQIDYSIGVDGHVVATHTGDTPDTVVIALDLANQLQASLGTNYSVSLLPSSSVIQVMNLLGNPITSAQCNDGYANTATLDLTKTVSSFSKLPPIGPVGWTIHISGEPSGGTSDYYVTWNGSAWQETTKPGLVNSFNDFTMPWKLVRQPDGHFIFDKVEWADRLVGDDISNPAPSFVGRKINDIYFFRGRLGFLSDENVCMSRSGEYQNFWGKTATAVVDTDPIDTNVGTNKVSLLKYAVPFDKSLLLFSDQTQFQLSGGQELLTPKTAKADVATEFDSGTNARPVGIGQAVYFGVTQGQHTGLREYYVDATTLTNDATDATAHVPTFIPANLYKLAASSSEDVIFALCRDEPSSVYVYKFFWSGTTKAQSAWLKFTFAAGTQVIGAEFINNRCYFIVNRSDGTYLEAMDLQPDLSPSGIGFDVLLDHRVTVTGVYDFANDVTNFTLPYAVQATGYSLVAGPLFTGYVGKLIPFTVVASNVVRAEGRWDGPAFFGQNYTMHYRFSQQYAKDQNQVAITNGKLKLRRFFLDYTDTGYFRVEVQPKARDTYSYPFTGKTLGTSSATLGVPSLGSGTFAFPVLTSNDGVRIEIINDSYLPSTFQSAGWDAEFVTFGRRV